MISNWNHEGASGSMLSVAGLIPGSLPSLTVTTVRATKQNITVFKAESC